MLGNLFWKILMIRGGGAQGGGRGGARGGLKGNLKGRSKEVLKGRSS